MRMDTLSLIILLGFPRSESDKSGRLDYLEIQNITSLPYAVLVFLNNNKFFCSGTIVDSLWVLTSAHCVYNMAGEFTEDDTSITVVAGADSLDFRQEDIETGKTQIRQSMKVIVHSSYTWYESFLNDLVIIQVEERFVMSDRVKTAPREPPRLMLSDEVNFNTVIRSSDTIRQQGTSYCRGYGFGKVLRAVSSKADFWLKAQDFEVDKDCICLRRVRSIRDPYNIMKKNNQFLCDTEGLKTGFCNGDNGGQLVCDGWLRGISTTVVVYKDIKECTLSRDGPKDDCGAMTTLSLFTDLCYHNLWLRDHIPDYPSLNETCNPDPTRFSGKSFY